MPKPEFLEVNEALSRASKKAFSHCCMNCDNLGQLIRKYEKKINGKKVQRFLYSCKVHPHIECGQQDAGCTKWSRLMRMRSDIPPVEQWGPF